MSRIQKLKQILTENLVPDRAEPGTVFLCKDTQNVWLAVRSGETLNLSDILDGTTASVRTPGPAGKKGERGVPGAQGEQGNQGVAGRDGVDGRSIQGTPGQNGKDGRDGAPGAKGDKGDKGEPGDITVIGPAEVKAAVAKARAAIIAREAKWQAALAHAFETNAQRKSPALKSIVDSVLRKMKNDVA